uniref:Uncharacterized protein n=1 Tax=Rhizophora mucronata TaxID=61149 RepID=A0A2P2M6E1_RHIMU
MPPSYVETYKTYTRQGSRVLALAFKSLPDMAVRLQCLLMLFHIFLLFAKSVSVAIWSFRPYLHLRLGVSHILKQFIM